MSNQNYYQNVYSNNVYVSRAVEFGKTLMAKIYLWMFVALMISAVTAVYTHNSSLFFTEVEGRVVLKNRGLLWGAIIAEFVLVFVLSAAIQRISALVATIMFVVYSALNGLTLSMILMAYTTSSVANALFVTAGTFGAMSFLGFTTKQDLTRFGSFLFMLLIGVIIASIVNIFTRSSVFDWIISFVGLAVFIGLSAYDTQKLKEMAENVPADSEQGKKFAIFGALQLYLDFVNIFLYLLRLFGERK
ncbi:MAG: Bax inhibitor-1/YccA family protein [Bacteroidia bacterium]|nr:Bax inhibitor-1/YccA family protein [Bacteroidia bacterium]MDW8302692.1 Bax inhibitor-1/YccA family protein [Bacteroidia bacterium]